MTGTAVDRIPAPIDTQMRPNKISMVSVDEWGSFRGQWVRKKETTVLYETRQIEQILSCTFTTLQSEILSYPS